MDEFLQYARGLIEIAKSRGLAYVSIRVNDADIRKCLPADVLHDDEDFDRVRDEITAALQKTWRADWGYGNGEWITVYLR